MPYLFCAEHGLEHEVRAREEQENYRQFGETVLIIKGSAHQRALTVRPLQCPAQARQAGLPDDRLPALDHRRHARL